MSEARRDADLAREPVDSDNRREVRMEDLDSDIAVVFEIAGQEDHGHAAHGKLTLDLVAAGNGGSQASGEVRHFVVSIGNTEISRVGPQKSNQRWLIVASFDALGPKGFTRRSWHPPVALGTEPL